MSHRALWELMEQPREVFADVIAKVNVKAFIEPTQLSHRTHKPLHNYCKFPKFYEKHIKPASKPSNAI